eukprot:GHVS01096840.1.p1 GENE.GHVS01096840.1~~GHVS01096840.1.p1  ORF type:complete len:646 (+),score=45.87 GHVS01096840.1:137-2074(+)
MTIDLRCHCLLIAFGLISFWTSAALSKSQPGADSRSPNDSVLPLLQNFTAFFIANEPLLDNEASVPFATSLKAARVPKKHQYWLDQVMWGSETYEPFSEETQRARFWTLLPWLEKVNREMGERVSWFFVATAHTRIRPERLEAMISRAERQLLPRHRRMFKHLPQAMDVNTDDTETEEYGHRMFGVRLVDDNRKIIHHFLNEKFFGYPLISSGVLIHRSIISELIETFETRKPQPDTHIDVVHELFKAIYDRLGATVKDAEEFCLAISDFESGKEIYPGLKGKRPNPKCGMVSVVYDSMCSGKAGYLKVNSPTNCKGGNKSGEERWNCEPETFCACRHAAAGKLAILVKTTKKHHDTRVAQIRQLWANDISMDSAVCEGQPRNQIELKFLSDTNGLDTVDLKVANFERGHCAKFFGILKYFYEELPNRKYLFIVDDDSLVNVPNLLSLLADIECNNAYGLTSQLSPGSRKSFTELRASVYADAQSRGYLDEPKAIPRADISPLYMGERYGYAHWYTKYGYDYITGGGGTLFDRNAVEGVMKCSNCRCSRPDEPDDMAVGRWMRSLGITARNYMGFHQASPQDYHEATLYVQRFTHPPISFHRLSVIDPNVAKKSFANFLAARSTYPCRQEESQQTQDSEVGVEEL